MNRWQARKQVFLPTPIKTQRLRLRPVTLDDATTIQRLAGRREVAAMTRSIPHPLSGGLFWGFLIRCSTSHIIDLYLSMINKMTAKTHSKAKKTNPDQ